MRKSKSRSLLEGSVNCDVTVLLLFVFLHNLMFLQFLKHQKCFRALTLKGLRIGVCPGTEAYPVR